MSWQLPLAEASLWAAAIRQQQINKPWSKLSILHLEPLSSPLLLPPPGAGRLSKAEAGGDKRFLPVARQPIGYGGRWTVAALHPNPHPALPLASRAWVMMERALMRRWASAIGRRSVGSSYSSLRLIAGGR